MSGTTAHCAVCGKSEHETFIGFWQFETPICVACFGGGICVEKDGSVATSQNRPSTKKRGPGAASLVLQDAILATLNTMDKPVTVRQLFYQLSVKNAVDKTEGGYRRAQRQILAMRRNQQIPYTFIADNTRWMRKPRTYAGLGEFFEKSAAFYRQALWAQADCYVEVWCEKDALAGVISPVTSLYDVPLMVARGYASESFAFEAADNIRAIGKSAIIYYVGDLDPSGWQMSQDLENRLARFGAEIEFVRLAVNQDQVKKWKLPARPTKKTDTRTKAFYAAFGTDAPSVELDALHPDILRKLVRDAIEQHLDDGLIEAAEREEAAARAVLSELQAAYAA